MDLSAVRAHYEKAKALHGESPQGVDWKDEAAQSKRLEALCLLFEGKGYSVNDWGCGYGLLAYMVSTDDYVGYDIIRQDLRLGRFVQSNRPDRIADYTVASGLFNVKKDAPELEWRDYVLDCIMTMDRMSDKGFGFNLLASDATAQRPELYYASPIGVLGHCSKYGRVSLLRHYDPVDFTIMVSK